MARAERRAVSKVKERVAALTNGHALAVTTPALAKLGDPLVTDQGEIIPPDPLDEASPFHTEANTPTGQTLNALTFKSTLRRSLRELPADPKVLHAVAAVFLYSVLGLTDREVCSAMQIEEENLKAIRKHSAYSECFDLIVSEFINVNSSLLAARIAGYSHEALSTVAEVMSHPKAKLETRLKAGDSLLDRAGVGPKEILSRAQSARGDLRITIVKDSNEVHVDIPMSDG